MGYEMILGKLHTSCL